MIRTVSNPSALLVREHSVFVEVSQSTGSLNECGRETVSVGLVVREFRVDVVVQLTR